MTIQKIWTRDFSFLMIGLLLISCANYYLASSISVYSELLGKSGLYCGLLTASFYFGSVGMRFVNGLMVQKYGAHAMLLLGAIICSAACVGQLFSGIFLLIIFRIFHGVGYSIFSTAGGTAASCLVPRERLAEGMGYFTIGNVLAMALGPSLALTIVAKRTISEYHILFGIAAALCTSAWLLTKFIREEHCNSFPLNRSLHQRACRHLPKTFLGFEKGVFWPTLISFLMTFSYSPVIVYLMGYGEYRGWSNVGIAFTFYAGGLLASRLFTGRFSDRYGANPVMLPAYLCGRLLIRSTAWNWNGAQSF